MIVLALLLGGGVALATNSVGLGVLSAGVVWGVGYWRQKRLRHAEIPTFDVSPENVPADAIKPPQGSVGVEVVCKQVTAERQEWRSVTTGRLYDVLAPKGLVGAQPGDRAQAIVEGVSTRIVPLADAERGA